MTTVVYPDAATFFAAACACVFIVVGIVGKNNYLPRKIYHFLFEI